MDINILKDLYQNLDTIDNFIILVENNYDPDKKLLYQILKFLNDNIVTRVQINIFYDLITTLLLQKNYSDKTKYFEIAVKTRLLDIIELLIKNKININEEEFKILENIKDAEIIINLLENNGYADKLKKYFIVDENILNYSNIRLIRILLFKYKNIVNNSLLIKLIISEKIPSRKYICLYQRYTIKDETFMYIIDDLTEPGEQKKIKFITYGQNFKGLTMTTEDDEKEDIKFPTEIILDFCIGDKQDELIIRIFAYSHPFPTYTLDEYIVDNYFTQFILTFVDKNNLKIHITKRL
ncbi:MAG: hypothetical protein QW478_05105 [Candidatus Micrarchaeaceae archaeon]